MSKVLFLVNHDVVIYNFRLELVERLLSEGHEVIISSPYGDRIEELIKLGCTYQEIEISRHGMNVIEEIKLILKYKKLIKNVCPDIVLTYTIKPNIYGNIACKKYNIPCIANITGLGTAVENKGLVQKITILLYKYSFSKIKKVFFQNEENMNFFNKHKIAIGKHKLIPGSGVNLDRFEVLEYPKSDIIEFAFISRIMKEKGIEQYLEAAEYIRKKYKNTKFHICGFCEEEYEERLNLLEKEQVIEYHGMVRNIKSILKRIHCTVHPSYYPEGISNVLLESCASGRPIITTNRSGCKEVVIDGINGYMVEPKNGQELIRAIERFIHLSSEIRAEMGKNGRMHVEKCFDRQIVVQAYMEEIKELRNDYE